MEYNYRIELDWNDISNNKIISIPVEFVKSLLIDRDYDNKNMPTLYLNLYISRNLTDQIILNKDKSTFILRLFKSKSTDELFEESYINDEFLYFISDDINYNKNVEYTSKESKVKDDEYREILIGMLNKRIIDMNKQRFNGVFTNTSLTNLLMYYTEKIPNLLFEKPNNCDILDKFVMPSYDSLSKVIKHIDEFYHIIYNTPYRFFMDFDRSYLLSSSGNGVPVKNEYNIVNIDIKDPATYGAVEQGLVTDITNKSYYVSVNANDTKMYNSNLLDKDFNSLMGVSENNTKEVSLSSYTDKDTKRYEYIRIYNNNFGYIDNYKKKLEMSTNILVINKSNIDCSVFNINKQFNILNIDDYNKYNGSYILSNKRELYIFENNKLKSNLTLYFKLSV